MKDFFFHFVNIMKGRLIRKCHSIFNNKKRFYERLKQTGKKRERKQRFKGKKQTRNISLIY